MNGVAAVTNANPEAFRVEYTVNGGPVGVDIRGPQRAMRATVSAAFAEVPAAEQPLPTATACSPVSPRARPISGGRAPQQDFGKLRLGLARALQREHLLVAGRGRILRTQHDLRRRGGSHGLLTGASSSRAAASPSPQRRLVLSSQQTGHALTFPDLSGARTSRRPMHRRSMPSGVHHGLGAPFSGDTTSSLRRAPRSDRSSPN